MKENIYGENEAGNVIAFPTELNEEYGGYVGPSPSVTLSFDNQFQLDVTDEIAEARSNFPGTAKAFAALVEEVGEVAKAFLDEDPTRIYDELVQVACMAQRLATEGDPTLREEIPADYV